MGYKDMRQNGFIPIAVILFGVVLSGAILYGGSGGDNGTLVRQETVNSPKYARQKVQVETTGTDPTLGDPEAPVTMVLFEDFECPFCSRFTAETLPLLVQNEIKQKKVRLVWKDFPLSIHIRAAKAHKAARCAQDQGKFWEYHDVLFQNQHNLSVDDFQRYALQLNLDRDSFDACLRSEKHAALVREGVEEGLRAGISGTPAFLVNGTLVVGALPYQVFSGSIQQAFANVK